MCLTCVSWVLALRNHYEIVVVRLAITSNGDPLRGLGLGSHYFGAKPILERAGRGGLSTC